VFVISSSKYYSKVFILQILKIMFDRKVYCLSKKSKNKYVTVFLFILYSMRKIFSFSLNYQTFKLKQNTQNARSVSCVH